MMMETHVVLKKYFERKKKSDGLSLRELAKYLEVSPSFLSRIFNGEKSPPYNMLLQLKKALDIEPEVFENLKKSHKNTPQNPEPKSIARNTAFEGWELSEENSVRILRQWFYLPILEFLTLTNFDGTNAQIARKLGLSNSTVEIAVNEMISLGLIELDNTRPKKAQVKLRWGSAKSLAEIRNFHAQMLVRAQDNLRLSDEINFKNRLITGITLSAKPEKIEAAKAKLAECLHEIANDLTSEPGTEVFQLAAQLFPLTKLE